MYSTLASTATSAADSVYENRAFFSKPNLDLIYQIYVFDEFESQLDTIEVFYSHFSLKKFANMKKMHFYLGRWLYSDEKYTSVKAQKFVSRRGLEAARSYLN